MSEAGWLRHGLSIGVVEFRRTVRGMRRNKGRLALLVFGVGFWTVSIAGLAILFTAPLRSLDAPIALPAATRGGAALAWLFGVYIVGQRVLSQYSHVDSEAGMLTTVSARSVATGLVIAELLRAASYLLAPLLVVTGLVVYIFGTPLGIATIPLAAGLFALTATIVGSGIGYAGALLVARSRFVARYKTIIGVAIVTVIFGGYAAVVFFGTDELGIGPALLAWLPVGWFVDLAAIGSPLAFSTGRVAGVLVATLAVLGVGGWAIERLTTALWFADPVEPTRDETDEADAADATSHTATATRTDTNSTGGDGALTAALGSFGAMLPKRASRPTRCVAAKALVRTWRNPSRLTILLTPVIIAVVSVFNATQFGAALAVAPVAIVLLVPWLAGATFGLNPFGDEGAVLPATLTGGISGRAFVRGLALPGLVAGLPLTIALTFAAGWFSPYSPLDIAGLAVLGGVLVAAAVGLAPVIGMRIPRFSTFSVRGSRDVVPPSITAGIVYTIVLVVPGVLAAVALVVPALLRGFLAALSSGVIPFVLRWLGDRGVPLVTGPAPWFEGLGPAIRGLATIEVRAGGYALPLLVLLVGGLLGYRAAARRFDTYEIT
ncbi:hypothetical protein [Halococcus saccharolyticus]|uniref:ABC-2 type transport system permease protein n=1 Tax=Halococcus saccharolyticus DSM 5350 TaxID=1227455 RepID=M0MLK8_9EURY|nr:hypothetical protein [Halococcus saccharolyticus]EMA46273.1 hypothetical protein C449_04550 [Halococcus saccharolyticus DSM 5350]